MIKRVFSMLICIALLSTAVIVPMAAGAAAISVENAIIQQGTTSVDIKIDVSDNPGLVFAKFNVTFDEKFALTNVTDGELWGNANHSNNKISPYVLYWNNGTAESDFTANGTIAILTFSVEENIEAGTYPISVSVVQGSTFDYNDEDVEFSVTNGSITVTEKPKENITGVTFSDKTVEYNGQEQEIAVSGTLPEGAEVTYSDNKATDAGTYNATATVTADGYNDLELDATLTINPKELTISGLKAQDKTYDSTTDATVSGGILNGKISGDDVSAQMPVSGTFASKNAGSNIAVDIDDITLTGSDKENYTLSQPTGLTAAISKAPITITADDKVVVKGGELPALTYSITSGTLFGGDEITGSLSTTANTNSVRDYSITKGTLTAGNNYNMTFEKGTLSVVDKTPQNITVSAITAKTYGDAAFVVTATPDEISGLTDFTYESSNPDTAEIAADGTVTIKATGETTITVKQAGNTDYAAAEASQKLVVNQKEVAVTSINPDGKTAVLEGVLSQDSAVALDFDKLSVEITGAVDETTSNVTMTNLVLTGEKSENYKVTTESVAGVMATDNVVNVEITADKGSVTGGGSYIKGSRVTVTVAVNSGYRFTGWYIGEESVSTNAEYTFTADADTQLTAKFKRKSTGGGSSASYYNVTFETNGGTSVNTQRIKENSTVKEPTSPIRNNYTFAGWYRDKALTEKYDFTSKVTKSMTLYAAWEDENAAKTQMILTIGKKEARVWGEVKANDVAPKIVKDRTMLPARFVAENLGAEVAWSQEEQLVTITKGDTVIKIYIGSEKAYVNGEEVILDSEAFIENDRTYTPLRFIAETLGAEVDWNEAAQTVTITK